MSSIQKVVDKNANLLTNNVVSRGQYSSSVFPRTITLNQNLDNNTMASNVVLGETAWQFRIPKPDDNTRQEITLSIQDSDGANVDPTVAGGVWQTNYNWENTTHKVVCHIGSNLPLGQNPTILNDVGVINGTIKTDASPASIVLERWPVGPSADGAGAPITESTGAAKATITIMKRNLNADWTIP